MKVIYWFRNFVFFTSLAYLFTSCACPGGKEYRSLDGERVNELKARLSQMTEKEMESFSKDLNLAKEFIPRQVILKFKEGTSLSKIEETLGALGAFKSYQFKSKALLLTIPDAITKSDVIAIVAALNEVESVDYAVPNGILKVSAVPNDPELNNQSDLNNIRAQKAWDITTGSHDVLVGIIDTGVDYLHPDLVENIWTNRGETGFDTEGNDKATNGIDDDNNGYVDDLHGYDFINNDNDPMDDYGHGTHVAGTIGASGNNGIGVAGINWRVGIVPLKFIGADGGGSEADAVKAIEYATQMGITITNNSWGGLGYNQALKDAIEAYGKKGGLFVAAAGNNSTDNDIVTFFPANYELDNIISVAAVDDKDEKPDFSNWGPSKVDIAAPGVNILSLAVSGSGNTLARMSGTSMAAPHVTGAAALIRSVYPNSDYRALKTRIIFGADQVSQLLSPSYSYDFYHRDNYPIDKPLVRGGRRLNIQKSLESDVVPPGLVDGLRIVFSGLTSLELRFQVAGDDGASGEASGYLAVVSSQSITREEDWLKEKTIELSHVAVRPSGLLGAEISGLSVLQKGYVTIRSVDNAGNVGRLNSSIPFEMAKPTVLFMSDGESYDGINSSELFFWTQPFKQEEIAGRGKVWSDSPNENRGDGNNYMEFTQNIEVPHPDVVLQFDTKLDCTAVYERAMVEIRINEETDPFSSYSVWNPERGAYDWLPSPNWKMLGVYSAPKCDWSRVTIPLRNKLKVGDKVRFRFWYKGSGDPKDGHDGWLIDDIKLIAPGNPEKPTNFRAMQTSESSPYTLRWNDNSSGETRFEIRSFPNSSTDGGTLVAETEVNNNQYELGQTTVDPNLKVRACNGIICSDWSNSVQIMAPPPRVISISPTAGPLAGGNALTVTGAGFLPGAVVRIHGIDCPNSVRVSATQMTCTPGSREAGMYNVAVLNPDSQRGALASAYSYQAAPTILSISPTAGPLAGGNTLTVTGSGFLPGAVVRIQGVDCPNSMRISSTQMSCVLSAKTAGTYNVAVVNTDLQRSVLTGAYNYQAVPSVSSITPTVGRTAGGELITINGTGFLPGAVVKVGAQLCTSVTVVSSNQIQCRAPANAERSYNIWVTNFDGQVSIASATTLFRVFSPKWVATNGGACSSVCSSVGLFSRLSPEGSYCTSGEMIPASAVGKVTYRNGCWPFRDCRSQGTHSAVQVNQYCYGASQKRDKSKSDITMGCFCDL